MFTHKHECLFCTLKFYHLHQNNSGVLGSPGLEFHLAIRNSGNCAASRHQFPQFYWLNSKDFFAGFWIQALGSGRFTRILQSEMENIAPLVALKIWWLGCGSLNSLGLRWRPSSLLWSRGLEAWGFWRSNMQFKCDEVRQNTWLLLIVTKGFGCWISNFWSCLFCHCSVSLVFFPGALIGLSALVAYQADRCYGWTGRFIKMECGMIPEITFYGPSPHVSTS